MAKNTANKRFALVGTMISMIGLGHTQAPASYSGDLHVKFTVNRTDMRSPEQRESAVQKRLKIYEAGWKSSHAVPDQISATSKRVRDDVEKEMAPETQQEELWIKGDKWLFVGLDHSVWGSPKTIWLGDGQTILKVRYDGSLADIFYNGSDHGRTFPEPSFVPDIVPFGAGNSLAPVELSPIFPQRKVAGLSEGWMPVLAPSHLLESGADEVNLGAPNLLYLPSYSKHALVDKVAVPTEVRIGSAIQPRESWSFEDYRLVSDHPFAFKVTDQMYEETIPSRKTIYTVNSLETSPVSESTFDPQRYLVEGAAIGWQLDTEKKTYEQSWKGSTTVDLQRTERKTRLVVLRYHKGTSLMEMLKAGSAQAKDSK
jgi:hypothetical protein